MRRVIFSLFVLLSVVSFSAYAQTNKVLSLDGDGDHLILGKKEDFNTPTFNNNDGTLYGDTTIVDQLYVSTSGSDSNDGSKEYPFRTIQYAISQSRRNDIITVLAGTYEENITLVSDLVLQGSGADDTIITMSSGNVVTANNVYDVTLSGFTIDGQGTADNGILCSGSTSEMEIRNNTIMNSTYGIYCTDSAEPLIDGNKFLQNIQAGIYCIGTSVVKINDNYINNNSTEPNGNHGIVCENQTNTSIDRNFICQTWRGIACGQQATVVVEESEIRDNDYAIYCSGSPKVYILSNDIANNARGINCHNSSNVKIKENLIRNNNWAIFGYDSSHLLIARNIIKHNSEGGIYCGEYYDDSFELIIGGSLTDANQIIDNTTWRAVWNRTDKSINATYNYWGTDDESEIENMMSNGGEGSIIFKPFIGDPEIIGDVSGSGGITAYDASLILQYCVGLIDHLPANISSIGSNITPCNRTISIPDVSVKANELISVPVVIDKTEGLVAGGITIKYDTAILKSTGVKVTHDSLLNNAYWQSNIDNNEIRFAFSKNYLNEPNNSKTVAILEFEPLGNVEGITTNLIIDHAQIAESLSIAKFDGQITFLPSKTLLLQNYPNPFNPDTWIPFKLSDDANVVISIYDIQGQLVRKIGLGKVPAGMYLDKEKAVYWNGQNDAGERVSGGIYFYHLQAGSYSDTKRMLILK